MLHQPSGELKDETAAKKIAYQVSEDQRIQRRNMLIQNTSPQFLFNDPSRLTMNLQKIEKGAVTKRTERDILLETNPSSQEFNISNKISALALPGVKKGRNVNFTTNQSIGRKTPIK